eukprot:639525-Amphidinium_carterae.1
MERQGRDRYDLEEHTLHYLTHLPGDTVSDDARIEQIQALEDDIESIDDEVYEKKRRQEELDYPEETYWLRQANEGHHEHMMEEYRQTASMERIQRRDERRHGSISTQAATSRTRDDEAAA